MVQKHSKNKQIKNNYRVAEQPLPSYKSSCSKTQLSIFSWNIQSSRTAGGSKFDDSDFLEKFTAHDIVCLQEIRQENKIKGFRGHTVLREGEKSGGVGIFYKNEMKPGIQLMKKHKITDVIVCKLKKSFFKFKTDRFVINAYITPANSPGLHGIDGRETLNKISNLINDLQKKGHVYLCGDFNSRIADHPGLIKDDTKNHHVPLPDDYICDNFTSRTSQDMGTNSFSKDFLMLIMNNSLTITNGRTLGDIKGSYTCITPRGSSVIDFFAVSNAIYGSISHMEVQQFTIYSDHKPIILTITTDLLNFTPPRPLEDVYKHAPKRFLFDDSGKEKFLNIQEHAQYLERHDSIREKLSLAKVKIKDEHITRPDIDEINETYSTYLKDMANECFEQTKNCKKKKTTSQPWFDWSCKKAKRLLKKAARATSNYPDSTFLRENFYKVKGDYRKLLKKRERAFTDDLNKKIEDGNILNWRQFNKLKRNKADKVKFDSLDMLNFEAFFAELYADKHQTIDSVTKEVMMNMADNINKSTILPKELENLINSEITSDEVYKCISSLKSGKASSEDMISNEILKNLERENVKLLTDMFNVCFTTGVYPWNINIITPLHKKGSKDDPDNYRAVAVSSVLGKLFSTVLLERFINFRRQNHPDPPNQLGFTKGAQTYDHILTMQTITAKYKKLKKPVYATFVDFRKAFDSVCRPALFLKLAKSGINGKFYSVLRDMYQHSYGHIKLEGFLSKRFNIRKGTEQGHPLSPDLFKHFLNDLSLLIDLANCPELNGIKISHLLWADDLILLALDKVTAQNQLNLLNEFCIKWGIEVNVSKTKSMIISDNKADHEAAFKLGDITLTNVKEYCYLGINLHNSGKMKVAIENLKTKATRAYYGLKRTVSKQSLSFSAVTNLFDSLIKPIILYGAPLWLPSVSVIKHIATNLNSNSPPSDCIGPKNLMRKIASTPCEKLHLSFLKWALGVHRKASNIGTWGDSGRYPLIYEAIKLTINYYKRISNLKSTSLVHAAMKEQIHLNLPWYKSIKGILQIDKLYHMDHVEAFQLLNRKKFRSENGNFNVMKDFPVTLKPGNTKPHSTVKEPKLSALKVGFNQIIAKPRVSAKFRTYEILKRCKHQFMSQWQHDKENSAKLNPFYNKLKNNLIMEPYLKYVKNSSNRYQLCRLRISAHDLEIERGRYSQINRADRVCKWCSLSMGESITEDENHMIFYCDLYNKHRQKLVKTLRALGANLNLRNGCEFPVGNELSDIYSSISIPSLKDILLKLHSPTLKLETDHSNAATENHHDLFSWHHIKPKPVAKSNNTHWETLNNYIHNSIGTFIGNCFHERSVFLENLKPHKNNDVKNKLKSSKIIAPNLTFSKNSIILSSSNHRELHEKVEGLRHKIGLMDIFDLNIQAKR